MLGLRLRLAPRLDLGWRRIRRSQGSLGLRGARVLRLGPRRRLTRFWLLLEVLLLLQAIIIGSVVGRSNMHKWVLSLKLRLDNK